MMMILLCVRAAAAFDVYTSKYCSLSHLSWLATLFLARWLICGLYSWLKYANLNRPHIVAHLAACLFHYRLLADYVHSLYTLYMCLLLLSIGGGLNCCRVQAARATFIVCIFILGEEREPDDKVRFLAAQKHKIQAQHKIQLQLLQLRPKSQCHDDHYLYCAVHATQSKHQHRTHNTHIYVCTM